MWYDLIKQYYLMGLYTDENLDLFVLVGYITSDQEAEIKTAKVASQTQATDSTSGSTSTADSTSNGTAS